MIQSIIAKINGVKDAVLNPIGMLKALWQKMLDLKAQIMKAVFLGILIFLGGYFFTWWSGVMIAFVFVLFKREMEAKEAFGVGLTAGTLVWATYAGILNVGNEGFLAGKISEMVSKGALSSTNILEITGVIGGLLCAFGAMTGCYAREWIYDTRLKFGWKW